MFSLWQVIRRPHEWEIFSDSNAYENVLTDKESVGYFGSFQAPFKFKSFVMRIYDTDGGNLIGNTSAFWSMGEPCGLCQINIKSRF